jgi:hypothetical protein
MGAMKLAGTSQNDFCNVPYNAAFDTSSVTVACWVRPSSTTVVPESNSGLVEKTVGGVFSSQWLLRFAEREFQMGTYLTATIKTSLSESVSAQYLLWNHGGYSLPAPTQHYAMSYNASTGVLLLYLNGVLRETATAVTPAGLAAGNGALLIGKNAAAVTGDPESLFQGTIDEVAVWSRVLTSTEVSTLYNVGVSSMSAGQALPNERVWNVDNLVVNGKLTLVAGGATAGLTASSLGLGAVVTGTGTQNFLPKWDATGAALTDSAASATSTLFQVNLGGAVLQFASISGNTFPSIGFTSTALSDTTHFALTQETGARVILNDGATGKIEFSLSGVAKMTLDSTGLVSILPIRVSDPSSGIGYATGAGGTVTQITSKSTTVVLNKITGAVTMQAAALAGGAKVSFTVTNSTVAATDGVVVWIASGGTANAYRANVVAVGAGSFAVAVENITAGSLSESPVVGFAVIKSVTA